MNIEENLKSKKEFAYNIDEKGLSGKAYPNLTAPPAIDLVWRLIIKHEDIYNRFCMTVIGGILDRKPPSESNLSVYEDYTRTLEFLNVYKDVLHPFTILWPEMSHENMEFEYLQTISISKKRLSSILKHVEKLTEMTMETSLRNWQSLIDSTRTHVLKKTQTKATDPRYAAIEITLKDGKVRTCKNLFTIIKNRNHITDALKARLQDKYIINENTAELWINEYYKYLVIKCKLEGKAHPSTTIQNVINTHMEFTKDYRHFTTIIGYTHGKLDFVII